MHIMEDQRVRKTVIVALGFLSLFLAAKAIGEFASIRYIGTNPSSASQISVSGKGEVVGIPDVATFSFSVTEESLVVKEAQDANAQKVNAILDYLKQNGVDKKDITTSGYNIYPRYEYGTRPLPLSMGASYPYPVPEPGGKQKLAAYVVTQTVTVKVRKLEDAGKLLAGIGEQGATDISGLTFDFDKRDELVKEARDKAIGEARSEAQKLAKALGVRLVRIVSYNENGYYPVYGKMMAAEANGGGDASAPPQVPVGEDKVTSSVTITYEIK